ncbi:MAG: DUF167 domain-containing protein [Magnetococcales bacterium]|nr:DUF167 domain-containing protein [Magnetococcales bacterium]
MEPWRWDGEDLLLMVRVQPRASRAKLEGVREGRIRAALTAPPVEGAANAALRELLAEWLGVAKGRITIERGEKSREKQVRVAQPDKKTTSSLLERLL